MTTSYIFSPAIVSNLRNQGVTLSPDGALFTVWAPTPESVELHLVSPEDRLIKMENQGDHYAVYVPGIEPGTLYYYRLDNAVDRPDPASRYQPEGPHGPSEVVSSHFGWTDEAWTGVPLHATVLYELHVGTFTPEGTFEALIPHLGRLKELGVTTLNIMPVAQFPGNRNWGYDGVLPYAVQNSYGGPDGFRKLIDAAHSHRLAVVLDLVYNHFGPEGNYLASFGPYFTDCYTTPWGGAINFDREHSDHVREFFLQNAEYWINEFHMDGFRLDATHFILDSTAKHFLAELKERVELQAYHLDRRIHLFAESDANDVRYISSTSGGGYNLDCQWLDDFHHALYSKLAGAGNQRYLTDYGMDWCLPKAYDEGYVYSGQYSPFRKRRHGNSSRNAPGSKFVVFIQNHDQVGNKPDGTRIAAELSFEGQKMAAAAYLLSPYLPMIFMGEEYGETTPFLYFTSHTDEDLINKVREGRKAEFADSAEELPDPQDEGTFRRSVLNHTLRNQPLNSTLQNWYQNLLTLRRNIPGLRDLSKGDQSTYLPTPDTLLIKRSSNLEEVILILNFAQAPVSIKLPGDTSWSILANSAASEWMGPDHETVDSVCTASMHPESALLLRRLALTPGTTCATNKSPGT